MNRGLLFWGAINAALAIALGAFGAHGLKHLVADTALQTWHTAAQYHFYHAFGIIVIGLLLLHFPKSRLMPVSGWLMMAGIVLFSFSLYALSVTGTRSLGMITPFGGVSFLTAWILLAYAIWKEK